MMHDLRCKRCGAKLAEYVLQEGMISIKCNRNLGKGMGSCNTMNIVQMKIPQKEKSVI